MSNLIDVRFDETLSNVEFSREVEYDARSDAWHANRAQSSILTSTQVAVAAGMSQYKSAKQLWAEKTGRSSGEKFSDFALEIMKRGSDEECLNRRLVRRLVGHDFYVSAEWRQFAAQEPYAFLTATPDGFLHTWDGESEYLLELKRCERLVERPRLEHQVQVLVQCLCTGASGGLLSYVSPANGVRIFKFEFDAAAANFVAQVLLPRCREFLACVVADKEPPRNSKRADLVNDATQRLESVFVEIFHYSGTVYSKTTDGRYELRI
jgi:hypothetical protein